MSLAMTSALPCAHAKAGCNTKALRPQSRSAPRVARSAHVVKASVADLEMVPDSNRRTIMNLLLVGAIGLPVASLAGYVVGLLFLVPVVLRQPHHIIVSFAGLSSTFSCQRGRLTTTVCFETCSRATARRVSDFAACVQSWWRQCWHHC